MSFIRVRPVNGTGVESVLPPEDEDGAWGGPRAQFVSQFTGNATLFALRIQAAVDHVRSLPEVDGDRVALVGYCLGGTGVVHYLNVVGDTEEGAAGAVGIHPSLFGAWGGPNGEITIPSLFLTGGSDFLTGPQAMGQLEEDMKNASSATHWETVRYAKIDHAFSNWFSDNYDERADFRSWESMSTFFAGEFGQRDYDSESPPPGPSEDVQVVDYTDTADDGFLLRGYLSVPDNITVAESTDWSGLPAIVVIPDGTGPDRYEQQRITQVAKEIGYVGFAADIYGYERMENPPSEPEELMDQYVSDNRALFVSRIQAAVDYVKGLEGVDPTKIAVVGFGFGGTGALYYALSDGDAAVKTISSFHGELGDVSINVTTSSNSDWKPQILIESGIDHNAMSDIVELEQMLIGMEANYEISRYSGTQQAFTNWNDSEDRYNSRSSARSLEAGRSVFKEMFGQLYGIYSVDEESAGDDGNAAGEENGVTANESPSSAPTMVTTVASSAMHLDTIFVGSLGSAISLFAVGLTIMIL